MSLPTMPRLDVMLLFLFGLIASSSSQTSTETCENGATFHGGGVVISENIANFDAFTLEAHISIRDQLSPGIVVWLDIGNLRYKSAGGRIYFQLASWSSRNGGTDNMPHYQCNIPYDVDYVLPFHVAGTVEGNRANPTMKMYFNGIEASDCQRTNVNPSGFYLTDSIGAHATSEQDGSISNHELMQATLRELRVWKVARTQQQIRDHLEVGIDASSTDLVAAWNFSNAEFVDGGNVPEIKGEYDGTFKWVEGGVHCNTVDTTVLDVIANIERKVVTLVDALVNQTERLTVSRAEVDNSIVAVATNITTLNASVQTALLLQSKMIGDQATTINDQSENITNLRTMMLAQAATINNQSQTIESLRTMMLAQAATIASIQSTMTTAGDLPLPSTPTPTCEGNSCGLPSVATDGEDLMFTARSGSFHLDQCTIDMCGLNNEISLLRAAIQSLKNH